VTPKQKKKKKIRRKPSPNQRLALFGVRLIDSSRHLDFPSMPPILPTQRSQRPPFIL